MGLLVVAVCKRLSMWELAMYKYHLVYTATNILFFLNVVEALIAALYLLMINPHVRLTSYRILILLFTDYVLYIQLCHLGTHYMWHVSDNKNVGLCLSDYTVRARGVVTQDRMLDQFDLNAATATWRCPMHVYPAICRYSTHHLSFPWYCAQMQSQWLSKSFRGLLSHCRMPCTTSAPMSRQRYVVCAAWTHNLWAYAVEGHWSFRTTCLLRSLA